MAKVFCRRSRVVIDCLTVPSPGSTLKFPTPGSPPCESKADPVAAKRDQKSGLSTWIIVTFALTIAALAAVALISDERLHSRPNAGFDDPGAPEADEDHDRDQIDQASRDQLRKILRDSGSDSEIGD
jgi:hypothetical protein